MDIRWYEYILSQYIKKFKIVRLNTDIIFVCIEFLKQVIPQGVTCFGICDMIQNVDKNDRFCSWNLSFLRIWHRKVEMKWWK